jgi:hypothetical protein
MKPEHDAFGQEMMDFYRGKDVFGLFGNPHRARRRGATSPRARRFTRRTIPSTWITMSSTAGVGAGPDNSACMCSIVK